MIWNHLTKPGFLILQQCPKLFCLQKIRKMKYFIAEFYKAVTFGIKIILS